VASEPIKVFPLAQLAAVHTAVHAFVTDAAAERGGQASLQTAVVVLLSLGRRCLLVLHAALRRVVSSLRWAAIRLLRVLRITLRRRAAIVLRRRTLIVISLGRHLECRFRIERSIRKMCKCL